MIDHLLPPHPAHHLSCGRGVEAMVRAILDGHPVLYTGGKRLDERGMIALLQPGCPRAALNDDRLGHILDALFAANLTRGFSTVALRALAVSAIPPPWLPPDTTTIALYGAYEDDRQTPEAPRPASGQSKDGRAALKQVRLSLGGSGDGGVPLRLGVRDGNRSDSVATPVAIAACLAWGLEGVRGIVADSQASSRRTLGVCLEQKVDLITLVPRTCAIRQALEAWGQQHPALPLLLAKPGRTQDEAPRRWHGHSVLRQVEVASSDGRVTLAALRCVVVHASQLAQQQTQPYAAAHAKAAEAVMVHAKHVPAQWFACEADATAAIAEDEGRGPGRRGRRPQAWRSHAVRYRVVADTRYTRRARRGHPAKTDPPPTAAGYRLLVEVTALANLEEEKGWAVLATTVPTEACEDTEILQAYQEQHTTVEPGLRWSKNPAAIAPVWREKPERIAA